MTQEEIMENAETYKSQIFKILDPEKTIIDFNSRWLEKLSSFEIINLTAKYTIARILERDDFSNRLKQGLPISVHEILYPLMQGYDSVALKADVELGGTDQKFNLLVGREIQREFGQEPQVILTMPLLEGLDGVEKMSKSLNNYVGITEDPTEIFGKIMSISDELMFRYYELLTDHPLSQLEIWKAEIEENKINPKDLKTRLAASIIADFWGEPEAERAAEEFERVFKHKDIPTEMEEIEITTESISLVDLLVGRSILPTRGEAKRMIRQGGVYLDGERIEDIGFTVEAKKNKERILKVGKRKFYRLKF